MTTLLGNQHIKGHLVVTSTGTQSQCPLSACTRAHLRVLSSRTGQLTLSIPSSSIFFTFMLSVDFFLAYVVNTSIGIALSNGDGGIYERNEGES